MDETESADYAQLLSQMRGKPNLHNLHWDDKRRSQAYFMVTAPPKSGSTWVNNVLSRSLNARRVRYSYAWSSNEHDIYAPALLAHQTVRTTAQMHMKATPHNIQLMLDFDVKPVVLTRNVFDTLASFARDLKKKHAVEVQTPGTLGYSFVWLGNCKSDWAQADWIDYSLDYYLPWYLNFLSSWAQFSATVAAQRIRYETLYGDEVNAFGGLIRALDKNRVLDQSSLGR
ncbi:MAG: hypothetical protein AAF408_20400, partial [Pseudomonadota bacterium]